MVAVSVILPACKEEEAIAKVLADVRAAVPGAEIIVVDDGSPDKTGEIARQEGAKVIRHVLTAGAGKSVKDGIEAAIHERIVMLDSDGTYPADRIPEFLALLDTGYDLVIGARQGQAYRGSVFKFAARLVFQAIAQFATGKRIPDINSGMRAFRKSAMIPFFPHLCNGFSLPTTMTLSHLFTGKAVTYLPIDYRTRIGKSKVRIVRDSLRTLQYIMESIATFNPTKLFLMFALLQVAVGLLGIVVAWWLLFAGLLFGILTFAVGLGVYSLKRP